MIYVILLVVVGLAAYFGTVALVGWTRQALDSNRKARVESDRQLQIAENALRRIANATGEANVSLEAEIALDQITSYHEKELK